MKIPFSPPDISDKEIKEVIDTLESGWITTGPKTKKFERRIAEYCNTNKAVCMASATASLEAILRFLGIGPGDEVITSAYTYTATASPVCHTGAKLVLVDTAEDSFIIDYNKIEEAITERTKAIIPVDLGGMICDYDRVFRIVEAKKHLFEASNEVQEALGRIAVIADGAHAFGAMREGKMCGEIADFTSFSFHAVKNLTTAEGGALTWRPILGIDNEKIYKDFMLMSLHGQSKDAFSKTKLGAWEYDVLYPAYKMNMTDITASIGLRQLDRYPEMLEKRRKIIMRYDEALRPLGIKTPEHYTDTTASSGHLYLARIPGYDENKRNELIIRLAESDIAANVHYKPLPMMTAYKNLGFDINDYPNAYRQYENEITLPLYTKLTDDMVDYILTNVQKAVREGSL